MTPHSPFDRAGRPGSTRFATLATAAALLAAATAGAQGIAVFPSDHADPANPGFSLPGASNTPFTPLSWGVARQMMVYESWDLKMPNGAKIKRLGVVGDEAITSTGFQIRLQITMGPTTQTAATASSTYALNYTGAKTEVYSKKILSLPTLMPKQQLFIPLDSQYVFDSSQNLVVEYVVDANSNSNTSFTYYADVARFLSPIKSFGTACQTSGGRLPALQSQPTKIGSPWQTTLSNGPGSSNAFLNIGIAQLPTPIPVPQAPGCLLLVAPIVTLSTTTNTSGVGSWSVPVPDNLRFYKARLYTQAILADVFANNFGFVFSNGDEMHVGVDPRATRISNTGDLNQTTGSVVRNFGLISLFDWQP